MKPVLTSTEMAAVDAGAQKHTPLSTLIERAGFALARAAVEILGYAYGSRVLVIAGKGHNGDDGRVAARLLERRGAKVRVVAPGALDEVTASCDLVIDAAFGTGFKGTYVAPVVGARTPVLAVDIPSGLGSDLGDASDGAVRATHTVTFGALKPGLLLGKGPDLIGDCWVEPIGLEPGATELFLMEDLDLDLIPTRDRFAHKWRSALFVLAGSKQMRGAADLSVEGALRTGAGMVRCASPGVDPGHSGSAEAVAIGLPLEGYAPLVTGELSRCKALVVGPGLGVIAPNRAALAALLSSTTIPVLVDADALTLLGSRGEAASLLAGRVGATILTPHEGEFARLSDDALSSDRLAAVRALSADLGAIVLLKGPTTIVASPSGAARLVTSGTPQLATAGSGDVLSGVIGALLARGMDPLDAASVGAHLHGRAARAGLIDGMKAGDLPALVAQVLSEHRSTK